MKPYVYILMFYCFSSVSCMKQEPMIIMEVTTSASAEIHNVTAVLQGEYDICQGSTEIIKVGFFISDESGVGLYSNDIVAEVSQKEFKATICDLEDGQTYYYKAYVLYKDDLGNETYAMGNEERFAIPAVFVKFKDNAFKTLCLSLCDENHDGKISYEEAESVTGHVNFANRGISDLTGIRAFKNITELELWSNTFSALNLSGMENLQKIWVQNNLKLKSINLKDCSSLKWVEAHNSSLTSIDFSDLPKLETVYIQSNPRLTEVDFSNSGVVSIYSGGNIALSSVSLKGCNNLYHLEMWGCGLTEIDFSNLKSITNVYVQKNSKLGVLNARGSSVVHLEAWQDALYMVDCSGCSRLYKLFIQDQKTSASGEVKVDDCTGLGTLQMGNSKYTSVDVSTCPNITNLVAANNMLVSVNICGCQKLAAAHFYDNKTLQKIEAIDVPSLTDMNLNNCNLSVCDVSGCSEKMNLLWAQNNPNLKKITLRTGQVITDFRYSLDNVEIEYK